MKEQIIEMAKARATSIKDVSQSLKISNDKARYWVKKIAEEDDHMKIFRGMNGTNNKLFFKYVTKAPVAEKKAVTKIDRLKAALQETFNENRGMTRQELMDRSGFDKKNLAVSLSMLKKKGWTIKYNKDAGLYTLD
ncbi:MAG: hypothetical protein RBS96_02610 [Dehalococcoidales bacterium]|jgi:hypothetical protein|nr:hypothetical protein [Syntrophales bacterium]MDX9802907.1 hypothetical protein [Dehalococcoidales bacterium]